MKQCPKCHCDLRVGEVKQETGCLVYRRLCANRQCTNYKQIVEEERREIRDADGDAESPLT